MTAKARYALGLAYDWAYYLITRRSWPEAVRVMHRGWPCGCRHCQKVT